MCVECVGNFVCHVCVCLACALSETCVRLCRCWRYRSSEALASGVGDPTGRALGTLLVCVSYEGGVWARYGALGLLALRAPRLTLVSVCAGGVSLLVHVRHLKWWGDLSGRVVGTSLVCVSCVWSVWARFGTLGVLALRAPRLKLVCVCAGGGATGAAQPSQVVRAT